MKALLLNIKDRLFCHWITSLIGLIIGLAATIMLFCGVITVETFCFTMPSMLPLFFSKDSWLIKLFSKQDPGVKAIFLIALLGAASIILSGCYTRDRCNRLFPPSIQIHDSIHTEYCETIRDTTIHIPADSSWLRAWLKCDSAGNVYIDQYSSAYGQNTNVLLQLKNNILYVKFLQSSYDLRLQLKDKLIRYYQNKQTTIEHTTNQLLPWQKTLLWIAGIISFIALIIFVLFIYKKIKNGKS